ncbi:ParB N-terminal domain-containing protein [Endozoicomonas atrinae]|uniref:ParB N-terminal domain-containing protein n=1 Tax=Endozoicomonas atrinae TaxID=1333660 RepID=UPI003AFFD4DA
MDKLKIVYWPLKKFSEYENNPRKNDHAVDQMAQAIDGMGFKVPVIAKSSGLIVDGHLRFKAAKKLGLKNIPVIIADDLTETQIKAFRIMINQSAHWADWDMEKLSLEVEELKTEDFDLDLLGFDENFFQVSTDEFFDVPDAPPASGDSDSGDREPRRTDEGYSAFELVMLHENKLRLIEVINEIKNDLSITATEDALMVLVDRYVSQEEIH